MVHVSSNNPFIIMSVLVNLPSVIFTSVITDYLRDCHDLIQFDSACCNHTLRNVYLNETGQLSFSVEFPSFIEDQPIPQLYNWARLRNIKLAYCYLSEKTMIGNQICYDLKVSEVQGLYILGCSSLNSTFVQIINSCANLTWLKVSCLDSISEMNTTILANLSHLECWKCSPSVLKIITQYCRKLECFSFNGPSAFDDLVGVLEMNQNLVQVALYADSKILNHIVELCPRTVWIDVFQPNKDHEQFDLTVAAKKLSQTPSCIINLRNNSCGLSYGSGILAFSLYTNRNNDFHVFLGVTKGLKTIEVDQRGLINDSMINTLIMGNFSTLATFNCSVLEVSTSAIRRLLVECKSLTDVRLSQVSEVNLTITDALCGSNLKRFSVEYRLPTAMSVATELLQACPMSLIEFRLGTVYSFDVPLSAFKRCIEIRTSLNPFEGYLEYLDGHQYKSLKFIHGQFEEIVWRTLDDDLDQM